MNNTKLDIYRNDNAILNDAFDQAVMNIHIQKEQKGYRSFVVCGCEAGVGSTTVAINLAAACAMAGRKTVLIDGDMRKKKVFKHLNETTEEGLSNFLLAEKKLQEVIYETTTENLYYIPCGMLIDNPVRALCSVKMEEALKELSEMFEFIIFDMPAVNVAEDAKVIAVKADATVLISALGETSKRGLVFAANQLAAANVNLIGTIINKVNGEEYRRYCKDFDYFQEERYAKKAKLVVKSKNK